MVTSEAAFILSFRNSILAIQVCFLHACNLMPSTVRVDPIFGIGRCPLCLLGVCFQWAIVRLSKGHYFIEFIYLQKIEIRQVICFIAAMREEVNGNKPLRLPLSSVLV